MNNKRIKAWVLAICAASLATGVAATLYDGPAIDVFPVHEKIGKAYSVKRAVADGKRLFETKFNLIDGAGRPFTTAHSFPTERSEPGPNFQRVAGPDGNACAGCHYQPMIGGSGDFAANVFAAAPQFGSQLTDSISAVFSNERNTRSLFGIGGVEILATEMSRDLIRQQNQALQQAKKLGQTVTVPLVTKGVPFGSIQVSANGDVNYEDLQGVSPDLVIKPFGSKGTVTSIREFTIVAINQHHGIQPTEFFGSSRTGSPDFDGDGVKDEFSKGQTTALSLFQAALPAPDNRKALKHPGMALFKSTGCASCHIPELPVSSNLFREPNEFNREGVLSPTDSPRVIQLPLPLQRQGQHFVVGAFTDLKRHVMCDDKRKQLCNEKKKQDKVPVNEFMTTRLWDLATSAPYCHRGDCTTLTEAIRAHGGAAGASADQFEALSDKDKVTLIQFLKQLGSRPYSP